jgi:hypothetical protein
MSVSLLASGAGDPQMKADPLADATVAAMLGAWDGVPDWRAIGIINRQLAQWQSNGAMPGWKAEAGVPEQIAAPLEAYVRAALALPAWADQAKIARAETLFMDYSLLSCTLLFCSSLPECYVIPDLSAVLHAAGQLEQHTEYRIRVTAAMIFPVMMKGGLASPDGTGMAQVLKVRLIHATIRHLILRGTPESVARDAVLPPLLRQDGAAASMHEAVFTHGWNVANDGLPCNQEELAYTLLTFGYVFLRSMRKLGLGLRAHDEEAYLHTWNVVGHILGIERPLMAETMPQAAALFKEMQARGRAAPFLPDPRPALGMDLIKTMESFIPLRLLRPFPTLLTRYLCGRKTARDIGLDGHVGLIPRALFVAGMLAVRVFDKMVRLVLPEFSITRLLTRVVGYDFTVKFLMDQTRPLNLPPVLLNQVNSMADGWSSDSKAPNWMNSLEKNVASRKDGDVRDEVRA